MDGGGQLVVERTKEVDIGRTISLTSRTDVQICSTVSILDSHSIPFQALAQFRLPGMSSEQVRHVLSVVGGRTIIDDNAPDFVVAQMQGKLTGSYITSSTMHNSAPDK